MKAQLRSNSSKGVDIGTMDLASTLNIVTIPQSVVPSSASVSTKKRKNNKYERRRRRAEQAKLQKQNGGKKSKENEDGLPKVKKSKSMQKEISTKTEQESHDKHTPATSNFDENIASTLEEHESKQVSEDESDSSNENAPIPSKKMEQLKKEEQNKPTTVAATEMPQVPTNATPVTVANVTSPKDQQKTQKEREEHAKYLAEFHARPLELDRRSGAVMNSRNAKNASFESQHLFQTQSEWNSLKLHPRLIQTLTNHSYFQLNKPTTVQSKAIQTVWHNTDKKASNFMLQSETGSGKTLAYLLPIIQTLASKLMNDNGAPIRNRKEVGTKCLILCPTRELATQTLTVLERLCAQSFVWMVPGGLTGGGDTRKSEKARIRKGLTIVVSTPGRLLDHLHKTESLLLSLKGKLEWLVLDECDRLLDMGLGDQVRQIVQRLRANDAPSATVNGGVPSSLSQKQQHRWRSILVSATVTPSVQELANERMLCGGRDWVWIKGGNPGGSKGVAKASTTSGSPATEDDDEHAFSESTPRQLAQFHMTVSAKLRLSTLVAFLVQRVKQRERTVVFLATCAGVDYYYALFRAMEPILQSKNDDRDSKNGIFGKFASVDKLHGNVPHAQRQQVLAKYAHKNSSSDSSSSASILLATDVAARGLNLVGVDWTVQYDPPCEVSDYVHRVGRVARAGKAGQSLLFLLPSEQNFLKVLEQKGVSEMTPMSLSNTLNMAATACAGLTKAGLKNAGGSVSANVQKKGFGGNSNNSRSGEAFGWEIQRQLEDLVVEDDARTKAAHKANKDLQKKRKRNEPREKPEGELLQLARSAFLSHIRAYPTKEKCIKPIFSARALHLGHVARSFALKEQPKALASSKRRDKETPLFDDPTQQRPSSLEFREMQEESAEQDVVQQPSKRKKRASQSNNKFDADLMRVQNGKALLLANAAKMQSNGLDAM